MMVTTLVMVFAYYLSVAYAAANNISRMQMMIYLQSSPLVQTMREKIAKQKKQIARQNSMIASLTRQKEQIARQLTARLEAEKRDPDASIAITKVQQERLAGEKTNVSQDGTIGMNVATVHEARQQRAEAAHAGASPMLPARPVPFQRAPIPQTTTEMTLEVERQTTAAYGHELQLAAGSSRCACMQRQTCPARGRVAQPFCNLRQNRYLMSLARMMQLDKNTQVCFGRTVAYQVTFGNRYINLSKKNPQGGPILSYVRCIFRFTLSDEEAAPGSITRILVDNSPRRLRTSSNPNENSKGESSGTTAETFVLTVAVDARELPFGTSAAVMRRNVKVFKMLGPLFFSWAKRIVWIDSKLSSLHETNDLRRAVLMSLLQETGACAGFIGLPPHPSAFGQNAFSRQNTFKQRLTLSLHAQTIEAANRIHSATSRGPVTDSVSLVHEQMRAYAAHAQMKHTETTQLEKALIDSALFVHDQRSPECRAHNAELGCAWLSEMACFSDRDQLSFPEVVVRKLNLSVELKSGSEWQPTTQNLTSEQLFGKSAPDRLFRDRTGAPRLVIAAPHHLHWYYTDSRSNRERGRTRSNACQVCLECRACMSVSVHQRTRGRLGSCRCSQGLIR